MKELFENIKNADWDWFGEKKESHFMRVEKGRLSYKWVGGTGAKETYSLADCLANPSLCRCWWGKIDEWYTTECDCGGVDFHIAGHDAHHKGCSKTKVCRGYEAQSVKALQILQREGQEKCKNYILKTMIR